MSVMPRKLTDEELRLLERGEGDELSTVLAPQRLRALEALLGEVAAKLASGADFIRRMDDYQCHNTTCYAVSSGGGGGRCTCGVKALGEAALLFAKDAESLAVRLRAAVEGQ